MAAEPLDSDLTRILDTALPLTGPATLDPLMERIGDARYVLLGEASHGTADYYRWRAQLTQRLITEKGFSFVGVEGDWPDCLDLHCSVTAAPGAPEDPRQALERFSRWPRWMWANTDVARFARWLRAHNTGLPPRERVGFHGLDVYSMWESLEAVLAYLGEHHPDQVGRAEEAYRCLEPYGQDPRTYALATRMLPSGCEPEVVRLLTALRERARRPEDTPSVADLAALQNAETLAGAERYYRALVRGGPEPWNIRDHHMADTLDRLTAHHGPGAKAVVWAHNTHVGDARATAMAPAGMVSVGQVVRERHAADGVVLVGFGSYRGTVVAGGRWGAPARTLRVPEARPGSVEELLHQALPEERALFVFPPRDTGGGLHPEAPAPAGWAGVRRDHRAIGVVYRPERDAYANYVPTTLAQRYDAFLYLDRTHALTPLHPEPSAEGEEETWPTGQ
ncbi:erythromycin esterase family protein [Streptomyces sp. NPDC018045]|uniref:erythromycin esterase family protein n=1 Tax=Streptomyces sp. NPDC018045 TaxID=3365037 RepID=UPI0037AA6AB8